VKQVPKNIERRGAAAIQQTRETLERGRRAAGWYIEPLGTKAESLAEVQIGDEEAAAGRLEDCVFGEQFKLPRCKGEPHAPRSACAIIRAIRS
jgi:hypothetical protein